MDKALGWVQSPELGEKKVQKSIPIEWALLEGQTPGVE
jgi:hypothetical protein